MQNGWTMARVLLTDNPDSRVKPSILTGNLESTVTATIINEHEFRIGDDAKDVFGDIGKRVSDVFGFVVRWHHD